MKGRASPIYVTEYHNGDWLFQRALGVENLNAGSYD